MSNSNQTWNLLNVGYNDEERMPSPPPAPRKKKLPVHQRILNQNSINSLRASFQRVRLELQQSDVEAASGD